MIRDEHIKNSQLFMAELGQSIKIFPDHPGLSANISEFDHQTYGYQIDSPILDEIRVVIQNNRLITAFQSKNFHIGENAQIGISLDERFHSYNTIRRHGEYAVNNKSWIKTLPNSHISIFDTSDSSTFNNENKTVG